jgi:transcriptional regulator with XRE-family HTH domain
MAAESSEPTIHRRRLRSDLRKSREAARKTQRDVAAAMDWSLSKLIRIETGQVGITTNDLRALLQHYGITDPPQVERYIELARKARERSWWSAYKDAASPQLLAFLSYESSASVVRNFEPQLVPGLLQTSEYAKEIVSVTVPDTRRAEGIEELVELRKRRQEILEGDELPRFHFIIDEAVIHRVVGGPSVMRRQLNHLIDAADLDKVTLRIVPFGAGIYPASRVAYSLFEFPDPESDPDMLYIEDPLGELVIQEDSPAELGKPTPARFLEIFFKLEQIARKEETRGLLENALAKIPD